jgi:hypothetical protein
MRLQFLRRGAVFASLTAGSVALLCHCGGSGSGSAPGPPSSSWLDAQASGVACKGNLDCQNPKYLQGQRPLCAAPGTCGDNGFCYFPSAIGECLPPESRYCDWTNGGYPACNQPDAGAWYPPNPSVCGLSQCMDSDAATGCYWSAQCSPQPDPPVPALPPGAWSGLAFAMAGAGWWMLRRAADSSRDSARRAGG